MPAWIRSSTSTLAGSLASQLRGERFYPQVAAPASSELLSLPLSRAQMEAVFGPPRRVYRVSEVRY